jgi:hypothetical protein
VSFEIVEPGSWKAAEPLGEGEVSLGKGGTLLARREDLELVGIKHYAIVLADAGTLRVGLRAVRDGEQQQSVAACIVRCKNGRDSGRRRINVARAARRLGLEPAAIVGRYELHVHGDPQTGAKQLVWFGVTQERESAKAGSKETGQ